MITPVIREVSPHWGCHNRQPFDANQVLYGMDSMTGQKRMVIIPNRGTRDCQYTKSEIGQADPRCAGCTWRQDV